MSGCTNTISSVAYHDGTGTVVDSSDATQMLASAPNTLGTYTFRIKVTDDKANE